MSRENSKAVRTHPLRSRSLKVRKKIKWIASRTRINVRYLTMESQEKRSVLNTVKVQAVEPTGEIEGADEGALICKQRSVYKINCLCVFLRMSQV